MAGLMRNMALNLETLGGTGAPVTSMATGLTFFERGPESEKYCAETDG